MYGLFKESVGRSFLRKSCEVTIELNADVHWRSYLFYLIMRIEYRFSRVSSCFVSLRKRCLYFV